MAKKKEKAVDNSGEMYSLYVQGVPINAIADKFNLESQEVVEAVRAVEVARE